MATQVQVKGLKELDKFLQQLPAKVEKNILRSALRAGANVVKEEAKARVPVDSGLLRDGLKVSTRSRRGKVTATVKTTGKHGFIAGWLEFGTAAHKIVGKAGGMLSFLGKFAKGVEHPGTRPRPFMRPALDAAAQKAVIAAGEQIRRRLTKQGINAAGVELEAGE